MLHDFPYMVIRSKHILYCKGKHIVSVVVKDNMLRAKATVIAGRNF